METYLKKKIVKVQFIAIYKTKGLEWREKRSENNLNSGTRITSNNILARKIHDTGEKNPTESSQASKNIQQEVEGQKNDKDADGDVLHSIKSPVHHLKVIMNLILVIIVWSHHLWSLLPLQQHHHHHRHKYVYNQK